MQLSVAKRNLYTSVAAILLTTTPLASAAQTILEFDSKQKNASPQLSAQPTPIPPARDARLLRPPAPTADATNSAETDRVTRVPNLALPKMESMATAGAGLGIVLGLFLLCMWLLRKSGPKPTSHLPSEAVSVLGRVPLAARNFAHLLQVGNKLVLVAITPEGVSPITEVTDPHEVSHLLGLCLRSHKHSTTAEFQSVLEQLAKEPAKGFLGQEVAASYPQSRR